MKETFIKIFEIVFKYTYSEKKFHEYLGYPLQVLVVVYEKTNFYNCSNIYDFLMLFCFIKSGTNVISTNFGICEKTFMGRIWHVAFYLFSNLHEIKKENWNYLNPKNEFLPNVYLIVDTTPFPVERSTNYYIRAMTRSVHYNMYCYKYQIIATRCLGLIVDIEGPYGGYDQDPDIFLFTKSDQKFPDYIYFFADGIYYGENRNELSNVVIPYRKNENINSYTNDINYNISSFRIIIENINHRLKNNKNIFKNWRYSATKHKWVVFIVANLHNIMITEGFPIRQYK
jgi:hypothetical protein